MNGNDAAYRRRFSAETRRLMPVIERHAVKVHRLGPRVLLELLLEVGCTSDCLPDVVERLERYATLTPEIIRLTGADRMIPRRPLLAQPSA